MNNQTDIVSIIKNVGGDPADLPFWEGCREGQFLLHRCNTCNRHYWPASRCIEHGSQNMTWVETSGTGTVHTYTVLHRALTKSMKDKVPFAVAVVQLDEGPFYHTNIVNCAYDEIEVGMRVSVDMIKHENGLTMPVFKPTPHD